MTSCTSLKMWKPGSESKCDDSFPYRPPLAHAANVSNWFCGLKIGWKCDCDCSALCWELGIAARYVANPCDTLGSPLTFRRSERQPLALFERWSDNNIVSLFHSYSVFIHFLRTIGRFFDDILPSDGNSVPTPSWISIVPKWTTLRNWVPREGIGRRCSFSCEPPCRCRTREE